MLKAIQDVINFQKKTGLPWTFIARLLEISRKTLYNVKDYNIEPDSKTIDKLRKIDVYMDKWHVYLPIDKLPIR